MIKQGAEKGLKEKPLFEKISQKLLALPANHWIHTCDTEYESIFATNIGDFSVLLCEWYDHYELKVSKGKEDVFYYDSFIDEKLESLFESIADKLDKFTIQQRNRGKDKLKRKKNLLHQFSEALEH